MNSNPDVAPGDLVAGDVVMIEAGNCPLWTIGASDLANEAAIVEGPNESWEQVHANVRAHEPPRHRVFAVRIKRTNIVAFVCEFMLRRIPRSSVHSPALRVITEHNR